MRRHATAVFATAVLCSFFALGGSAIAACPNEGFRGGPSGQLPDCRAYEMVSPVDMNGNGLDLTYSVRDDGERLIYGTINAFGDEVKSSITGKWIANRGAAGWTNTSLNPPSLGRVPSPYDQPLVMGVAGDLSSAMIGTSYPFDLRDQAPFGGFSTPGDGDLYRFSPGPIAEWISHGPTLPDTTTISRSFGGASADLSRVFFEVKEPLTPETAGSTASNLFERHGDDLVSVNVDASGTLIPGGAAIGRAQAKAVTFLVSQGKQGHADDPTAVSADGRVAYFTAPIAPTSAKRQLYARVDGARTIHVSRCQFGACAGAGAPSGAAFLIASRDGGTMLFFSQDRLIESAPEGGGIYSFDLGTDSLSFLTPMKGTLTAATSDLSTLYLCESKTIYVFQGGEKRLVAPLPSCPSFVRATSVSGVTGASGQGEPRSTPNSGYVFTSTAGPTDVAKGEAQVAKGEATVAKGEEMIANGETAAGEGQIQNGNFEIVGGKERIARGEAFGDYENAGFSMVYLYDAATGTKRCISCRPDGSAPEGDASLAAGRYGFRNSPHEYGASIRNLTDDGRRVVFASEDQLVPGDINGNLDVYEWERNGTGTCTSASSTYSSVSDGCVFLISSGTDVGGAILQGISADGEDVFFSSNLPLVPINTGTELQLFNARVGGGIASQQATPRRECEGEGCRGPAGAPPPALPAATTNSYSGEGNAKPRRRCVKPSKRKAKQKQQARRTTRQRAAAKPKRKQARHPRCTSHSVRKAGK